MKLNEQEKTERKQHIVNASKACFVRKGFHNTSMQDICNEAGMSAGNLYRYFNSKEEIIEAFAAQEMDWMRTAIQDVPSSNDMVQAITDTAFWTASTLIQENEAEMIAELLAEAGRNPRINAIYVKFNKQLIAEISAVLTTAKDNGVISPLHEQEITAQTLISLVDGLAMHKIVNPDFDLMKLRPALATMIEALLGVQK